MAALTFEEVLGLVNRTRITSMSAKPVLSGNGWRLHEGCYKVHAAEIPFKVLYLESKALQKDALDAKRNVINERRLHVVFAESIGFAPEPIFENADLCKSLKAYLVSFISSELDEYRKALIARGPKDFVQPQLRVPAGVSTLSAQYSLERFFTDPPSAVGDQGKNCAVLLATPGQGKTFMAEHLVAALAKKTSYFPIYVSSAQWTTMQLGDLASIAKTITNSFGYFRAQIGWLNGFEDEFLRTTLKAGHFCIVFDGFDEYILRNNGSVPAIEVLRRLKQLAEETDSRLLVTSRTTFWASDIDGVVGQSSDFDVNSYLRFELLPFDVSRASNYFEKRFPGNPAVISVAKSIFEKLRNVNQEFAGKGFSLKLTGDIAKHQGAGALAEINEYPGLWLLRQLCEREQLRQQLPLAAEQQLQALRYTASQQLKYARLTDDEVRFGIEMSAAQLDKAAVSNCLQSFGSHPLIGKTLDWSWSQEQVRILLIASHILNEISEDSGFEEVSEISSRSDVKISDVADISELMIDLIRHSSSSVEQSLKKIIQALAAKFCSNLLESPKRYDFACRLVAQLLFASVELLAPRGSTRDERADKLADLFDGRNLRGMVFGPSIARVNLSGFTFENCVFDNVQWQYCKFDSETTFVRCYFLGGGETKCEGFDSVDIKEYLGDEDGNAFIEGLQISSGRRTYSPDNLKGDIRAILRKFVSPDGLHFKTVNEEHLHSGTISRSRFKEDILVELSRSIIQQHEISGVSTKGYHVREEARDAVRFMAVNNSLSGLLDEVFRRLLQRI